MYKKAKYTIRTLRVMDCTERDECPGRHKIDGVDGSFVVAKRAGWRHRRALRKFAGRGEQISWAPDALFDPYPEEV
jgi:hypothetical protein